MNLLIIGGLVLIAVAAILGAIFLSISETRADKARANGYAAPTSRPTIPLENPTSNLGRPTGVSAPMRQAPPVAAERPLPTRGESQQLPSLNGQFRELAVELRSLYQQAWELEQRLRGLTEIVDRIEESQAGHFSIEEESRAHSSTDSATM